MKICHPKSVDEAIDQLHQFFKADMWTKFKPKTILPGMRNGKKINCVFHRTDVFKDEEELIQYLKYHFGILKKEIRRLKK